MEFGFNVNDIVGREITLITKDLVSEDFVGDYKAKLECASKMNIILDEVGWASAKAQGLQKPITSGQKLKDSEHILYLLVDSNGRGSIVGLLKVGRKKLFMFDSAGYQHEAESLCVLDFYVHESKQRTGCGKKLFEHMLEHQHVLPQHLAIDRPSEKFLSFLSKHYNLDNTLPQMNNFVVFDGFFDHSYGDGKSKRPCEDGSSLQVTRRLNSSGPPTKKYSAYDLAARNFNGRFGAPKQESTMGFILQNGAVDQSNHRSEVHNALNGSSHSEHATYTGTQPALNEGSCPVDFLRQKTLEISEEKSAFRHSRLW